ncbi:glycosyltransferase [Desulfobacterales bacterium HSG16]|nr:glycosyltransferase [Desulfobacterales bacterium HSG16]
MGAIHFSIDRKLVNLLQTFLNIDVFIETGTYRGDAIELVRPFFKRLFSIECSDEYFQMVSKKYSDDEAVTIMKGDSRSVLSEIVCNLNGQNLLYWLDAHWCADENTAGEFSQCPLIAEIDSIGNLNQNSALLIDDARLFMCSPGKPHEYSQWPNLNDITKSLDRLSDTHNLMIINDVILFYPEAIDGQVRQFAHEHGVSWLDITTKASEYDRLTSEHKCLVRDHEKLTTDQAILAKDHEKLTTDQAILAKDHEKLIYEASLKDREIANFAGLAQERQQTVEYQKQAMDGLCIKYENEIEKLGTTNRERLHIIENFEKMRTEMILSQENERKAFEALIKEKDKNIINLSQIAEARLEVIHKQQEAIEGFKRRNLKLRLKTWLAPRIGNLYHYQPRSLHIPGWYTKNKLIDEQPSITIVTPSYGQADFIEETIKSVIDQRYDTLEYKVQDGGSTDGTTEILKAYEDRLAGWESKKDRGQAHAIDMGFKNTKGEIMAYLNSDDLILPGTLHYVADYFKKHPDVDVIYGHRVLVDEYGQEIGRWVMPSHDDEVLSWADFIPQETMFWRRRIWEKAGNLIDESFKFAMDWDLILRFREAGAKFVRVPRFLGAFRVHPHQKTSGEIEDLGTREMNRLRKRCHGRDVNDAQIQQAIRPYLVRHILFHKLYRAGLLRY